MPQFFHQIVFCSELQANRSAPLANGRTTILMSKTSERIRTNTSRYFLLVFTERAAVTPQISSIINSRISTTSAAVIDRPTSVISGGSFRYIII